MRKARITVFLPADTEIRLKKMARERCESPPELIAEILRTVILGPLKLPMSLSGTAEMAPAAMPLISNTPQGDIPVRSPTDTAFDRVKALNEKYQKAQPRRVYRNRRPRSGYKGVYAYNMTKWAPYVAVGGKQVRLGQPGGYESAIEAARVYDEAMRKLEGSEALLNFPNEGERDAATGEKNDPELDRLLNMTTEQQVQMTRDIQERGEAAVPPVLRKLAAEGPIDLRWLQNPNEQPDDGIKWPHEK